jgi:hypothetical protein
LKRPRHRFFFSLPFTYVPPLPSQVAVRSIVVEGCHLQHTSAKQKEPVRFGFTSTEGSGFWYFTLFHLFHIAEGKYNMSIFNLILEVLKESKEIR